MKPGKCALIITSSVYVSARYTALSDPAERQRQYLDSISWFIRESPLTQIIVCDNSGYTWPVSLYELALTHGKKIELLSFTGNNSLVEQLGKGYGEGEIMEYIMTNSLLLGEVDGFLKVTGRLKLVNSKKLIAHCQADQNYFMPVSLLRPKFLVPKAARPCVDVRVYYVTKTFFLDVLLFAYKTVRDDQTFFLEHAYYQAITRAVNNDFHAGPQPHVNCFPVAPEITGMSGSNGWVFRERSQPKKLLIRLVAKLGYIRPV
jgi:hypothetical protein